MLEKAEPPSQRLQAVGVCSHSHLRLPTQPLPCDCVLVQLSSGATPSKPGWRHSLSLSFYVLFASFSVLSQPDAGANAPSFRKNALPQPRSGCSHRQSQAPMHPHLVIMCLDPIRLGNGATAAGRLLRPLLHGLAEASSHPVGVWV